MALGESVTAPWPSGLVTLMALSPQEWIDPDDRVYGDGEISSGYVSKQESFECLSEDGWLAGHLPISLLY